MLSWIANHSNFNFQQYCVEHASPEKNTLVEAGAGTGKTYSMVSRVAYLCNKRRNNISCIEDELAMVTFTNDAAINMKKRLKQMFVNYYILTGKENMKCDQKLIGTLEMFKNEQAESIDSILREIYKLLP